MPNWSRVLDYWELHTKLINDQYTALEIGAGKGGLSYWVASKGFEVYCTDLQNPEHCIKNQFKDKDSDILKKIKYQSLDVLNFKCSEYYDLVFFKSVLGGLRSKHNINTTQTAIRNIHSALKMGGELWFAENIESSIFHQLLRKKFTKWSEWWNYSSKNDLIKELSIFSEINYVTIGVTGVFGRTKTQKEILSFLDKTFIENIVPPIWHYIIVGVAVK